MPHDAPLVTTIAAAFVSALLLGVLAKRVGLSPIVGYLLAGVVIGPYTPGFVGDVKLAAQLAEVGVVLLMFGVGLHFHPRDLLEVRGIALPGALLQSGAATLLGLATGVAFGWSPGEGLVLGLALSVASTVVLIRVLEDRQLLSTIHGHVAVGWLVVEDILTVAVLVTIPVFADISAPRGDAASRGGSLAASLGLAMAKLAVLVALVFAAGSRVVPWVLEQVARLRSRELFTLTVLAVAVAIATGSALFFGASMALGAFLAGMVVGQSPLSHQAAADALPLRDAFAVLFFVSVGMLFEPGFLLREPLLVLATLAIVLVGKPLVAMAVVAALGYSVRTGLTVALGLAQVGEFSFILGSLARHHGVLPPAGENVLVACALVSISVNPLLMRSLDGLETRLRRWPGLWRLLTLRGDQGRGELSAGVSSKVAMHGGPLAIVVGYGPVGQAVDRLVRQAGIESVVIDVNPDTVATLASEGRLALYGDATRREILEAAGVERASHLVVTLPHSLNRAPLIAAARELNPSLQIFVRARYLRERRDLELAGATAACFEEAEAAVGLAVRVLRALGTDEARVAREAEVIRRELAMGGEGL
jgi:CPA2 family monovalent cation:H+ antiporter-2